MKISKAVDCVTERLSTGKKVNSPLDGPTNYFTALSYQSRLREILVHKDSMSEAISRVRTAETGLSGIASLLETAKGVANAALAESDGGNWKTYSSTYNTLLTQLNHLADDSGYRGNNLLNGDSVEINFEGADSKSSMLIQGKVISTESLGLGTTSSEAPNSPLAGAPVSQQTDGNFYGTGRIAEAIDSLTADEIAVIENNKEKFRVVGAITGGIGVIYGTFSMDPSVSGHAQILVVSGSFSPFEMMTFEYYPNGVDQLSGMPIDTDLTTETDDFGKTQDELRSTLKKIDGAIDIVREFTTELSNSMSVIKIRLGFFENIRTILEKGIEFLTAADMNEYSSNLLMLRIRQNMSISTLGFLSKSQNSMLALL